MDNLNNIAQTFISRREEFLRLAKAKHTPFYVFDTKEFEKNAKDFRETMNQAIPSIEIFYAMKLNHHPHFITGAVRNGFGIDVASVREFQMAIKYGAKKILFFSPAKTREDLEFFVKHRENATLIIDSFNELALIGEITNSSRKRIKAGVRIHTSAQGSWTKYGIDINTLLKFWQLAKNKYPYIKLEGIHFHTSRNASARLYIEVIKELGNYLDSNFKQEDMRSIKFIDFGGGFEPYQAEGYYQEYSAVKRILNWMRLTKYNIYYNNKILTVRESLPLSEYAEGVSAAIKNYLPSALQIKFYTEPGRVLCSNSMHIITRVIDIKDNIAITDAGVNLVGWQRFEHEYFPLVNLSDPSQQEREVKIYGKLCTPWDIWGYGCYANKINIGDLILVPYQGALTYSLAQNFILPIAKVYKL